MTLRELVTQHPEWLDHELAVLRPDGELDFIGHSGSVFKGEDEVTMTSDTDPTPIVVPVLVFAGN